ncbi:MAG: hypothetical protein ACR2JY_18490 [Chloroflexota bacterium]
MAREDEGFFADYDAAELNQQETVTLSHRDLLLIRRALSISLEETSRHDHIFNDIHTLLAKLPPSPNRKAGVNRTTAPDKWLKNPTGKPG